MEIFKTKFKKILIDENKTLTEIANKLDTKSQNLSNKLRRGSITYDDAQIIADILGYDIEWVKRK